MFRGRICLEEREYLGVLVTGATISIVAKKMLPCEDLKHTMPTAAIHMGNGHVVHSYGDCEVDVPIGTSSIIHRFCVIDNEGFEFVLRTNFFTKHPRVSIPHGAGALCLPCGPW